MKKRNLVVTSSIAVALFLSSYGTSQAAKYTLSRSRLYEETRSLSVPEQIRDYLSVDARDYREDLGIDPTFEDSLIEQGFNRSQIQKIFTTASLKRDFEKMPLSE
jgi:hypothetical protein